MKKGITFFTFYQFENGQFSPISRGFLSFEKMNSTLDIPDWLRNPETIADFLAYQKKKYEG